MWYKQLSRILVTLIMLGVVGTVIWIGWQPTITLFSDLSALRTQIASLGVWGPVALILYSVVQVLVAPLPGYPLVFVAGLLYGTWWGAIYANVGLLVSGSLAMALTRRFGRPLAERFIEISQLERIDRLLGSNSLLLWFVILLMPTGDYPYFVAGLSRVSFRIFFIALCLARLPFTFIFTNAAERSAELPTEAILVLSFVMVLTGIIAYWQQVRISHWVHTWLERLATTTLEQKK